jgi:Predicted membrane protein
MVLNQFTHYIQENFIYLHPGYTTLNTIVFGIILGLVILLIIRMFRWIDKDPKDLFIPLIPFIFFGSSARALVDNGIYPLTYLLVTPGIYLLTGISAILTLLGSVLIERKTGWDYRYIIFMMGVVMCLPNLYYTQNLNLVVVFQVLGSWALISAPFILIGQKWSLLKDKFNLSVLLAHLLDASSLLLQWTTMVMVNSTYYPTHSPRWQIVPL